MKPLTEELPEIVDWLLSLGGWPRTERRLARLVVELVEKEQESYELRSSDIPEEIALEWSLEGYNLDPAKFQELKRRVEENQNG